MQNNPTPTLTLTIGEREQPIRGALQPRAIPELLSLHTLQTQAEVPYVALGPAGSSDAGSYRSSARFENEHLRALAQAAGIEDLLFDVDYGLLAAAPGVTLLRPEHLAELQGSYARWRELHPDATPDRHARPVDQVLALLAWLTFWTGWALATAHQACLQTAV